MNFKLNVSPQLAANCPARLQFSVHRTSSIVCRPAIRCSATENNRSESSLDDIPLPTTSSSNAKQVMHVATSTVTANHISSLLTHITSTTCLPTKQQAPYGAIALLAATGCLETAYLTFEKLTGGQVVCPLSGGCASVLTSDYAMLLGTVPLSAAGMVSYGAVAALAIAAYNASNTNSVDTKAASSSDFTLGSAVFAGSVLLATTSAYLMYVLFTQFQGELCPWCITSAAISASIFALTLSGMRKVDMEDAAMPGSGLAAMTILLLSIGLGNPDISQAGSGITELEYKNPVVTTESSPKALEITQRLKAAGAKMYGAFWCSHCYEQKQVFGKEALAQGFPYVECFPEGWKQGVEMAPACKEVPGLQGFPTWVINGEKLEGDKTLEQLEEAINKAAASAAVGSN